MKKKKIAIIILGGFFLSFLINIACFFQMTDMEKKTEEIKTVKNELKDTIKKQQEDYQKKQEEYQQIKEEKKEQIEDLERWKKRVETIKQQ